MQYPGMGKPARKTVLAALCAAVTAGLLPAVPAAAATSSGAALLYDYEFTGTTGTVANSAPDGPVAPLTLEGSWSSVPTGVKFSGNTSGDESVAYGKPATGYTIDENGYTAVGFGARIQYYKPTTGKCFADTPNITQIGRFGELTQAKIQLSSCHDNAKQVMMECRLTGRLSPPSSLPLISTMPLVNNATYNVTCMKSPDSKNGTATITLSVTRISTGQAVTNTFTVPKLGDMKSVEYISAGNKYPMPAAADNTDQFNGIMTRTVYCAGTSSAVRRCLRTYLPVS